MCIELVKWQQSQYVQHMCIMLRFASYLLTMGTGFSITWFTALWLVSFQSRIPLTLIQQFVIHLSVTVGSALGTDQSQCSNEWTNQSQRVKITWCWSHSDCHWQANCCKQWLEPKKGCTYPVLVLVWEGPSNRCLMQANLSPSWLWMPGLCCTLPRKNRPALHPCTCVQLHLCQY